MSYRFIPAFPAREVGPDARAFVKAHHDVFLDILKPLLPYMIGLTIFDFAVTMFFLDLDQDEAFGLGKMLVTYFVFCLTISWHRVVLHGPDNYIPVNPFKPQKHELIFMGVGVLLSIVMMIAAIVISALTSIINPALLIISIPLLLITSFYFFFRVSFYFPAKAVDNSLTLKQAFQLTNGYVSKMFIAGFLATWRIVLLFAAIILPITIIGAMIIENFQIIDITPKQFNFYVTFIFNLPLIAYIQPLITILGVSVLSNYYQHALQNKSLHPKDKGPDPEKNWYYD